MPVSAKQMMNRFAPEERADIEAGTRLLLAEDASLSEIRKALNLTQESVAEAMDTTQSNIAQIERNNDILVSTLSRVVKALGGELHLIVEIPHHGTTVLRIGRSSDGRTRLRKAGKAGKQAPNKAPPRGAGKARPAAPLKAYR